MPKKLTKMPIDVEALLSSARFQGFKDFKKWWYMAILFAMWKQNAPGYVQMTENFYQIVGAHSRPMWDTHGGEVMAAFERVERDGEIFLYSSKVEHLWASMQKRYESSQVIGKKGRSKLCSTTVVLSISSQPFESIYQNTWKKVGKAKALKAIEKSIQVLTEKQLGEYQDRFGKTRMFPINSDVDAAEFLHEAVLEFATSPAGKDGGLFEGYTSPHPASWFNAQRFFDDRSTWYIAKKTEETNAERIRRLAARTDAS